MEKIKDLPCLVDVNPQCSACILECQCSSSSPALCNQHPLGLHVVVGVDLVGVAELQRRRGTGGEHASILDNNAT